MKSYSYGKPEGRRIGCIGSYDLYSKTLSEHKEAPEGKPTANNATEFNFIYGPSAGGLIESVQFDILTTGESIKRISTDASFKMRSVDVLGKPVDEVLLRVERINGAFAASHSIAFLSAVEDAMGIPIGQKTKMARIIELELERIRNHLHVAAKICESAAFGVPSNALYYLREKTNRIIGKYSGHRFFYGINSIDTVNADFSGVSKSLVSLCAEAEDIYNSLLESKIFIDRLQGNGVISGTDCVGPVARGAGLQYDARHDSCSLPYSDLGFSILTETGSKDAMGRLMIRFDEISQSLDLIRAAEKRLSEPSAKKHPAKGKAAQGLGRIESPSGDLAYYVELDGSIVNKIALLTPSSVNLPVFQESARGNVFTDFHFNWESFGIWVAEIAVDFV